MPIRSLKRTKWSKRGVGHRFTDNGAVSAFISWGCNELQESLRRGRADVSVTTEFCPALEPPTTAAQEQTGNQSVNPIFTWLPSQKGLLPDAPHRQSVTLFRIS